MVHPMRRNLMPRRGDPPRIDAEQPRPLLAHPSKCIDHVLDDPREPGQDRLEGAVGSDLDPALADLRERDLLVR